MSICWRGCDLEWKASATHSFTSLPKDVAIIIASRKLALPPALFELGKELPYDVPMRYEPMPPDEPEVDDEGSLTLEIGMGAGIVMLGDGAGGDVVIVGDDEVGSSGGSSRLGQPVLSNAGSSGAVDRF